VERAGPDIIYRSPDNPVVGLHSLDFPSSDICNAGVVKFRGEYLLLITVEALEGPSSIYLAHGTDGVHFTVDQNPFMSPSDDPHFRDGESLGPRDPRVTPIDGTYYIAYLADGDYGFRLALARTDDFLKVTRLDFVAEPDTKNGALFPTKIDGRYALLERPQEGTSIWITYSDDLAYWGSSTVVMTPRAGFWDSDRVGAAAPPMDIDTGWLLIYYGVKLTSAGPLFRLGAAILDKTDPSKVVARSNVPILSPREKYERIGDVGNLVFSCGALLEEERGEILLYYGGSDSCICLGTATVDDVVQACLASSREF